MLTRPIGRSIGRETQYRNLFFALIAVATVGYMSYRYLATRETEAEISAVRPYCELVSCSLGKCSSREPMACAEVPSQLERNQHVRRFQQARVEFVGADGQSRAAWAEIGQALQFNVSVGDRIVVHSIDRFGAEPEIMPRPSLLLNFVGSAAFLFFLSIGARMHHRRWSAGPR